MPPAHALGPLNESCGPCGSPRRRPRGPLGAPGGQPRLGGGAARRRRPDRRGRAALERRGAHWCRVRRSATSELLPRNLWWVSVRRWVSGVGISWVAAASACGVDPGTCCRWWRAGCGGGAGPALRADCRVSGRYEIESGMRIRVTRQGAAMVLPSGRRVPLQATYGRAVPRRRCAGRDRLPGGAALPKRDGLQLLRSTRALLAQRFRRSRRPSRRGVLATRDALGSGSRRDVVRVRADAGALHRVRGAVRLLADLQVRPADRVLRPHAPADAPHRWQTAAMEYAPPDAARILASLRSRSGEGPPPPRSGSRRAAAAAARVGRCPPPPPVVPRRLRHYSELLRDLAPPAVANLGGFRAAFDRLTCRGLQSGLPAEARPGLRRRRRPCAPPCRPGRDFRGPPAERTSTSSSRRRTPPKTGRRPRS